MNEIYDLGKEPGWVNFSTHDFASSVRINSSMHQNQIKTLTHRHAIAAQQEALALQNWIVESDDDQAFAAEMLQDVKRRINTLETQRKEITIPMNKALRAVNALFRKPRSLLEEVEQLLKQAIANYIGTKERDNFQALTDVSSATTAQEAENAMNNLTTVNIPKGISVRHVWDIEVFNPKIVPYEFLSPDLDRIKEHTNKEIELHGEPTPIPGVRFSKRAIVTSRRKK